MKAQLTAPELFSVLDREFHRARPQECHRCLTPLPIRSQDAAASNWTIPRPIDCPHRCNDVLEEIVRRLQGEVALVP